MLLPIQVSLQLLFPEASAENELLLEISNLTLHWDTPEGRNIPDTNPIGDLSNWFSLVKETANGGAISRVHYPSSERAAVVAFKKSLSQLFSVGGVTERRVEEGGVQVVREEGWREEQQSRRVLVEKVSVLVMTKDIAVHINPEKKS